MQLQEIFQHLLLRLVENKNGSRMRALPDELSPVTREVHALSSDYNRLSRDVRHFNAKVSFGPVSESQAEI